MGAITPLVFVAIFVVFGGYTYLRITHAATANASYFKSGIAGKCLDDWHSSPANGTKVDLYDCNNTAAQQWTVQPNGTTVMLVNANGACLDNWGNTNANHNPVVVYACNKADAAEQWQQVGKALVNPATGKCLDDPGATTTSGTQLGIYDCNNTIAQQWTPVAVNPPTPTPTRTPTPTPTPVGSGSGGSGGSGSSSGAGAEIGTPTTVVGPTCAKPTPVAPVTGYTIAACQDFNNGLGAFGSYSGGGDGTVVGAGRVASQCKVSGGYLHMIQSSNGATCGGWMNNFDHRYGVWEVRMRAYSTGTSGSAPHPVLILWPDSGSWTSELDFFETDLGSKAGGYLHCASSSGNASNNCYVLPANSVDYTKWHVYSFVWTPTSMAGYIDGKPWWSSTNTKSFQPLGASNLTMQLDNLSGRTPVKAGEMDVNWAHMFKN